MLELSSSPRPGYRRFLASLTALALMTGVALPAAVLGREASGPVPSAATPPTADALLQASDRARGPLDHGLTWKIDISTLEEKGRHEQSYVVKVKGDDALVECIAPAKHQGELVLQNGRSLWFYKSSLRKPMMISARQKLSGQAANGDIAFTHFSRDYDGTLSGEETVGGQAAYKLELKARSSDVTYDRINYWISREQKLGLKAEFLTRQGKVFKTASYEYQNKIRSGKLEAPFLSKVTIIDAAFPENVTILTYHDAAQEEYPDSLFTLSSLVGK